MNSTTISPPQRWGKGSNATTHESAEQVHPHNNGEGFISHVPASSIKVDLFQIPQDLSDKQLMVNSAQIKGSTLS